MKSPKSLFSVLLFFNIIGILLNSCSQTYSDGKISGQVVLPKEIKLNHAPKEARVYVYLKDYTPRNGKEVMPWKAPIRNVLNYTMESLNGRTLRFEFKDVPEGEYSVSVLIDTGRPHVSPGSLNFIAYPGDYTGGSKENISLKSGQTGEVIINQGMYITIPQGYEAPLYSEE